MLSTGRISRSLRALLDQIVPEICPACSLSCAGGFCGNCRAGFGLVAEPCPRCGLPQGGHTCPALATDWRLAGVQAPFAYAPPLARFLQALKFGRQRPLGRALGLLLAEHIAANDVDVMVAVPLHRRRLRHRGFNQADEIAAALGRRLALPRLAAGITRPRWTRPQTELDAVTRRRNLVAAFEVRRDFCGRRIAIIDDVMTSGATVNALAGALLDAGARSTVAWTVARALP